MRSQKKHGIHAILTGWLVVLAAFLGAVTDSRAALMVEHTHAGGHHRHDHHAEGPQDIHADHGSGEEAPDDHDQRQSGEDTHHHHLDSPNVPFCSISDLSSGLMTPSFDRLDSLATSEAGPDGPILELIKPPQIG